MLDGTTETSCNLWSAYMYDSLEYWAGCPTGELFFHVTDVDAAWRAQPGGIRKGQVVTFRVATNPKGHRHEGKAKAVDVTLAPDEQQTGSERTSPVRAADHSAPPGPCAGLVF